MTLQFWDSSIEYDPTIHVFSQISWQLPCGAMTHSVRMQGEAASSSRCRSSYCTDCTDLELYTPSLGGKVYLLKDSHKNFKEACFKQL